MKYASETSVPVERSRAEIENFLRRYGADQFVSGWADAKSADEGARAVIGFRVNARQVRFELPLPARNDKALTHYKTRGGWEKARSADEAERRWEQSYRLKAGIEKGPMVLFRSHFATCPHAKEHRKQ